MIDLNRQPKKEEESLGMVVAGMIPFLVIFLIAAMLRF